MKARLGWTQSNMADNKDASASYPSVSTSASCNTEAKTSTDITWSKSLEKLSVFTRKEIDLYRNKCSKQKADDVATLKRGSIKFQSWTHVHLMANLEGLK